MDNAIGLIVNPRSGGDVRRAVAAAARSTLEDKVSIVRRIVLGSMAAGVTTLHANYEPMQIVRRATETIRDINVTYCLLYTSPSPRDKRQSRMPSSA